MQAIEAVERDIRQLLQDEQLAVLSTEQQGQPYASLVAFAVTAELDDIFFCTPKTTRKFSNLVNNPRVAMLINNCRNQLSDIYSAISVTAVGKAVEVAETSKEDRSALYLQKHPHLKEFLWTETTALVQVRVERYFLVRKFQDVYEYKVSVSKDGGQTPS
ncbi:MAG: pyridoxamine 5'-phosphate oxidase family protein [Desulfobacteraceae bacterium]|jgi:nitroimidazol reductase NimA-like FMN-containing flavoprotein (pyridoxamine 5'-phosphate oxidase superfamily)